MLRITELKLPLTALPVDARRAADAPSETDEDRRPTAHPLPALTRMAAQALGVAVEDIQSLHVFKRSFDARKADLLAVFIVDVALDAATEQRLLAHFRAHGITGGRRGATLRGPASPGSARSFRVKPDFVFRPHRLAVFVDGCF